jgi:CO/xanthine dehydrogenase Mo-binding subunit
MSSPSRASWTNSPRRRGADPLAFRLAHCEDPRATAVLTAAARAGGWDADDPGGEGAGRGIAVARYKNSGAYYAAMVRVEVDAAVRVVSIHGAVDAISWTLKEEASWTDEGFAVKSWDEYPILGFREMPLIETEVIRSDAPPLGAGECSAGPVAGAIGTAVAHALGVRARRMPITRDRIMAALHAAE